MNLDQSALERLSPAQRAALAHVEGVVRRAEPVVRPAVATLLERAGCSAEEYDDAMDRIRLHARVVVHFHPDRVGPNTTTVAEALLGEGVYRNQFEIGLSSGSVSAFRGGARDTWEAALFGGAYHADGVTSSERPKYGALELIRYPDGPIPRFGSCYFVLRPAVSCRTSFTFMGSEEPLATERLGTVDRLHCVMAALLAEIAEGGTATPPWPPFRAPTLGVPHLTVNRFLDLLNELRQPRREPAEGQPGRVLDTQIEAHVHGPIELHQDVELLVADPAFSATTTGTILRDLTRKYGFPLRWHPGFELSVGEIPDDFRGPAIPLLAKRIGGGDGTINAAVIGTAERSLRLQPELWRDWGSHEVTLQHLKQLWHVLVHYGRPAHLPSRESALPNNARPAVKYRLRPARESDREFLYALHCQTMRRVIERTWRWDEEWQLRDFDRRFRSYSASVIEVEGESVGGLLLQRTPAAIDLVELQILPEHQRKGIGTSVLDGVVEDAARVDLPVTLSVVPANVGAKRLYERIGFQVVGYDEPFIRMRRNPRTTS